MRITSDSGLNTEINFLIMAARLFHLGLVLALFLTSLTTQAAGFFDKSPTFLPAGQAFEFDFLQQGDSLQLTWQIKPGYYLYRQKLTLSSQNVTLSNWQLPAALDHEDEFFGKTQIYRDHLSIPVNIYQTGNNPTLTLTWQGCSDKGFCYPPETQVVPLSQVVTTKVQENTAPAATTPQKSTLPFSPFWALLIGIGVAFTPCVLPMYPLISALILGQNREQSPAKLFGLGLIYIQGMAITYTLLGVIVAAAGMRFQALLQSPWVLGSLAILFILLSLSMFGLFNLQLPASIQTRLVEWSNRQRSGALWGVFVMGALAGLICSPCTTAPLTALLLYIAQSGQVLAGAGTLYLYAIGMGLPLLAVVMFGNALLPKRGPWMETIKQGFGFVILALPVFLLERILGESWGIKLWSLLVTVFAGWAFIQSLRATGRFRLLQIAWLVLALIAVRPLQDWFFANSPAESVSTIPNATAIKDYQQLQQTIQASPRAVTMLDLYADWCAACKEFEKYTFPDPQVQQTLAHFQRLSVDFTHNTPDNKRLQDKLLVLGLPSILFFDKSGQEIPDSRISGFQNATVFLEHIKKVEKQVESQQH